MKDDKAWRSDEQELMQLKMWRAELKAELVKTSKRIHILSTSINQHKKKKEHSNDSERT